MKEVKFKDLKNLDVEKIAIAGKPWNDKKVRYIDKDTFIKQAKAFKYLGWDCYLAKTIETRVDFIHYYEVSDVKIVF